MSKLIPVTLPSMMDRLKNTVMIGRFCNESAKKVDETSFDICFDVEPLSSEPFTLQNLDYLDNLFPSSCIYQGIDRDYHKQEKLSSNAYNLSSFDINKKKREINEYYNDKLVLYHPVFKCDDLTSKYNRYLEVIDVFQVNNKQISPHYHIVPKVDLEQLSFEEKLVTKECFCIESYPSSIYKNLKFVVCGEFLYQGSFVGHLNDDSDNFWRSEDGIVKRYIFHTQDNVGVIHSRKVPTIYFLGEDVFFNMQISENPKILDLKEIMGVRDKKQDEAEFESMALKSFFTNVKKSKLCFSRRDLLNFHICMKSSPLVIVAGTSGIGKTRIALEYAKILDANEENENLLFFPITPGLHDPSDITGYYNANINEYVTADGGLVDFLIHAQNHQDKMHLVIFDEMNLSQIEHYFAQFLSILELDEHHRILPLYNKYRTPSNAAQYPSSIRLNSNVLFVGTVNMDESTRVLSDRLLDRCFVVNLEQQSFEEYLREQARFIDEEHSESYCFSSAEAFKQIRHSCDINEMDPSLLKLLDNVNRLISLVDIQKVVSFRTVKNIGNYLSNAKKLKEIGSSSKVSIDLAFKQTICKKLEGDELTLGELLGNDQEKGSLVVLLEEHEDLSDFRHTRAELRTKRNNLTKYGYTSRR